ncbi:hypothetical protein IW262DRAFT_585446 [Armillaria fumosa]|nr:hypothetical protein IW262DRAFT_585446 [Armillaria fumosa]
MAFVIIDLSTVHRLETAAAQCFQRAVRDLAPRSTVLVLCGIQKGSGAHADFDRAGVDLIFDSEKGGVAPEKGMLVFRTRGDTLTWCKRQSEVRVVRSRKRYVLTTLLVFQPEANIPLKTNLKRSLMLIYTTSSASSLSLTWGFCLGTPIKMMSMSLLAWAHS